jgi:hypothetical protein
MSAWRNWTRAIGNGGFHCIEACVFSLTCPDGLKTPPMATPLLSSAQTANPVTRRRLGAGQRGMRNVTAIEFRTPT